MINIHNHTCVIVEKPTRKQTDFIEEHKSFLEDKVRCMINEEVPAIGAFGVDVLFDDDRIYVDIKHEMMEQISKDKLLYINNRIVERFNYYFDFSPKEPEVYNFTLAYELTEKQYSNLIKKWDKMQIALTAEISNVVSALRFQPFVTQFKRDQEKRSYSLSLKMLDKDVEIPKKELDDLEIHLGKLIVRYLK